jgi:LuxR family maltose regulon positive regulatory protein
VTLSDTSVALLQERTEGWAAGLRMAAISLARHPDPERFVAEFCGSERTVAGYLLAEVLERQPPEVHELLLRTSILERVSGPLADALTGGTGSEAILQHSRTRARSSPRSTSGGRGFVTTTSSPICSRSSCDGPRRRWSTRCTARPPDGSTSRVSWSRRSATRRRRAPGRTPRGCSPTTTWTWSSTAAKATLRALLAAFPADAAAADAELALAFATARLYDGLFDESAAHIEVAEQLAATVADARRPLFDLRLTSARLWLACQRGDLATAREAMRALEAQPAATRARSNDHRASAPMNLGIAELWGAGPHPQPLRPSRRRWRSLDASGGRISRSVASATSRSRLS